MRDSMASNVTRDLAIIAAVFIFATVLLYGYIAWYTPEGMETVYRNWDGPAYVVVARSMYDSKIIHALPKLPGIDRPSYYAQEFPLYPVFIRMFAFIGYEQSMIFVSLLFSLLFIFACYFLIHEVEPTANALVVSLLLIYYVPRWFVVSHVGSSEPVFLFFLVMCWHFFYRKRYTLSAVCLAAAQLARLSGAFFFAGFLLYGVLRQRSLRNLLPYFIAPAALGALFLFYGLRFGDVYIELKEYALHPITHWQPFINFFHPEGYYDVWKEGLLLLHLLYAVAIGILIQKKQYVLSLTSLPYYLYLFFVHHSDMSRYLLPLLPLVAIAFAPALSKKAVYIPMLLFVPVIFMIALSYISYNVAGVL